jgi:DNA-binding response OmpR family regulator
MPKRYTKKNILIVDDDDILHTFLQKCLSQHATTPNNVQRTLYMGHLRFDTKTNTVSKGDTKVRLTQMEACILTLLYFNAGTILSRDDIIEQVRGIKHHPQDRSVDMHINRIRKK